VIENFIGTKSLRKILEGLKRKVGIFIETKNIFNPKWNHNICVHPKLYSNTISPTFVLERWSQVFGVLFAS